MSRLGTRLFWNGNALNRYWENLEVAANTLCEDATTLDPKITQNRLRHHLRRLEIRPVTIGVLTRLTTMTNPHLETVDGEIKERFACMATVQASGSRVFWKALPEKGYKLKFPGKISNTSVRLGTYLPSLDPANFVAEVTAEVEALRDVLFRFQPTAYEWAARVSKRLDEKIRTF